MRSSFTNALLFIGLCGICGSTYKVVDANAQIHVQTAANVAAVNLTAREATLFQTVVKDVNAIAFRVRSGLPATAAQVELKNSADLFEQTLGSLANAHQPAAATPPAGTPQNQAEKPIVDLLAQIGGEWGPLRKSLDTLAGSPNQPAINATLAQLSTVERPLLGDLDALTDKVQALAATADARRTSERDLWTLGILVGILFVGVSFFLRVAGARGQAEQTAKALADGNAELQARTDELARSKRGTDALMETVGQGLVLIDADYAIEPQYSQQLEEIFERKDLAGQNFLKLFERLITARDYDATRRFLALMFNPAKRERVVLQVNPLDEIDLAFPLDEGGFKTKTISATFRRIVHGDKVAQAFVAISDITERAAAARELKQSEDRKERQFALLLGTIHVDPAALDDFADLATEQLRRINEALRAEDFASGSEARSQVLRGRLDAIYRAVHTIKGNASSLRIEPFVRTATTFEAKLTELRSRAALGGDDFLAVVIQESELRILLEQLREIRRKYVGQGGAARTGTAASAPAAALPPAPAAPTAPAAPAASDTTIATSAPSASETPEASGGSNPAAASAGPETAPAGAGGLIAAELSAFAGRIADERGSRVSVNAQLEALDSLDAPSRRTIKNVLIQLLRNSLAHGIELPDERIAAGKEPAGTISISASRDESGALRLCFSDDGRGLDPERLRQRAFESGIIGDPAEIDDAAAVGLIFHPGFSTAEHSDEVAGRGVGMDIIKQHVVDESHGEIGIRSDPGRYLEFELTFPALATVPA